MTSSLLVALVLAQGAPAAEPWTPAVQQQIAVVATRLMPPLLARQLVRYSEEVKSGALAPFKTDDPEYHVLNADGRYGQAAQRIEQETAKIVTMLNNHVPLSQVAYELGVVSHYVSDVASPLATSDGDPREATYASDFARYAERNLGKFPTVFDGFYDFDRAAFTTEGYLRAVSERANRLYPILGQAYYPDGKTGMASSTSFDDRSPAFGIAQLSYNHAVSAVANVWLYIWREAHGDISGSSNYVTAGKSLAQDPSRSLKRP